LRWEGKHVKIYSLQTLADYLGTRRRALQYFIDKYRPVPDRRIQQGKHSVRYFTERDRKTVEEKWNNQDQLEEREETNM
jgi:hypothetical protein